MKIENYGSFESVDDESETKSFSDISQLITQKQQCSIQDQLGSNNTNNFDNNDLNQTELVFTNNVNSNTYIIEPVTFIQNMATCIMNFSLGQFIYNRILNRLIDEARSNTITTTTPVTTTIGFISNSSYLLLSSTIFPNRTDACGHIAPNWPNGSMELIRNVRFNQEYQLPFYYLERGADVFLNLLF